ncbi:hypothetical protein Sme01_35670 [Sphaerisporangium melleum]|uniref:Uncharacterized protein n=1 Tax=Sphaerisporangium melleum TaxID=321316 RepID=A0A917VLG0_9ACTN|nr:hypothetical protein [Sphaerisporangium melleum]GGK97226.1 hypothetical protein GCM10007964_44320 [Sphaerisporangium melleum]GII71091.1 hypothetical protein Sme01_35670 [Sphaerisporangium melleum]
MTKNLKSAAIRIAIVTTVAFGASVTIAGMAQADGSPSSIAPTSNLTVTPAQTQSGPPWA